MTPRNKLTKEQWGALAEARRGGATIKQLQERFGVSYAVACEVSRNNDALPAQGGGKVRTPPHCRVDDPQPGVPQGLCPAGWGPA